MRLAELVAALSRATDLGLGLPSEHILRQTRVALRLADCVDQARHHEPRVGRAQALRLGLLPEEPAVPLKAAATP